MGRRERNISKTREERIAEWLGATKLTEAQVKEWMELGMCMSPVEYWDFEFTELPFHLCKKEDIAEQLASEKGEVAMEKAVRAMGYYLISWADEKCEEEPWASVTIKTGYGDANKKYDGTGKDHNSALQEAILQMLGKEK